MGRVRSRLRSCVTTLAAVLVIPAMVAGISGCAGSPGVKMLADKGTPYGDLLVPKISASVADGAVGVPVDKPITIRIVAGELSVDDEDQLQQGDTLDDRHVDDVLDEGYSPPDRQPASARVTHHFWAGLAVLGHGAV